MLYPVSDYNYKVRHLFILEGACPHMTDTVFGYTILIMVKMTYFHIQYIENANI